MKNLLDDIQITIDIFYQYREKLYEEFRSFPYNEICSDDYNVLSCKIKYLDDLIKRFSVYESLLQFNNKVVDD